MIIKAFSKFSLQPSALCLKPISSPLHPDVRSCPLLLLQRQPQDLPDTPRSSDAPSCRQSSCWLLQGPFHPLPVSPYDRRGTARMWAGLLLPLPLDKSQKAPLPLPACI